MDPLLPLSALAPLAVEWAKERHENSRTVDADNFRDWLTSTVFPDLLRMSDQALQTIISLKAHEQERYTALLKILGDISAAVCAPTPAQKLDALEPLDQRLLRHLYQGSHDDSDRSFELGVLATSLDETEDRIERAGRMLAEESYVRIAEFTEHWSIRLTPAGTLFAWQAIEGGNLEDARRSIATHLPDKSETKRLGELAKAAQVPLRIAHPIFVEWHKDQLLELSERDGGEDNWVVFRVTERLRRQHLAR